MVLPIHDVEAPEEIIESPCSGANAGDSAGVCCYEDAGRVCIGKGNPPCRKSAAIFGAFGCDARCFRCWLGCRLPRRSGNFGGLPRIDRWQSSAGCGVEQFDTIGGYGLGNGPIANHVPVDSFNWRIGFHSNHCGVGKSGACGNDSDRFAVYQMLPSHFVDGQKAHDNAAGKPDQQLRADDKRQPFVNAARGDMKAQAAQNQILTPATTLNVSGSSPASLANLAVSPVCLRHSTPM